MCEFTCFPIFTIFLFGLSPRYAGLGRSGLFSPLYAGPGQIRVYPFAVLTAWESYITSTIFFFLYSFQRLRFVQAFSSVGCCLCPPPFLITHGSRRRPCTRHDLRRSRLCRRPCPARTSIVSAVCHRWLLVDAAVEEETIQKSKFCKCWS